MTHIIKLIINTCYHDIASNETCVRKNDSIRWNEIAWHKNDITWHEIKLQNIKWHDLTWDNIQWHDNHWNIINCLGWFTWIFTIFISITFSKENYLIWTLTFRLTGIPWRGPLLSSGNVSWNYLNLSSEKKFVRSYLSQQKWNAILPNLFHAVGIKKKLHV